MYKTFVTVASLTVKNTDLPALTSRYCGGHNGASLVSFCEV